MGLIITSHKPNMLPTLIECSTTPKLLKEIVAGLSPQTTNAELIENLYRKHKGNIRDALRELYDITSSGLRFSYKKKPATILYARKNGV